MREDNELYLQREQSLIKHAILRTYLQRFARIVGSWANGLIYVDAFSGPWNSVSTDLRDASFAIAVEELRSARATVAERYGKTLSVTCIFLETDANAFRQLEAFAQGLSDIEVVALNQSFESAVPDIVALIHSKGRSHFPFLLIDPKGWTGFSMEAISPLIRLSPCEVLVNFMTGHIQRFIEDERDGVKASFRRLFGDDSYERGIEGLEGRTREDAIVQAYADRIGAVGGYPYLSTALVLQPIRDRTYFHLIYATRDLKGIEVFKGAERKALKLSESIRSDAKRRSRQEATQQLEIFTGDGLPDTRHLDSLRRHFESLADHALAALFKDRKEVPYDVAYAIVLRFPTVQESFLRNWIASRGNVLGAGPGKVPKIKSGCIVRFVP